MRKGFIDSLLDIGDHGFIMVFQIEAVPVFILFGSSFHLSSKSDISKYSFSLVKRLFSVFIPITPPYRDRRSVFSGMISSRVTHHRFVRQTTVPEFFIRKYLKNRVLWVRILC